MSDAIRLTPPLSDEDVEGLHIGDRVLISGTIYTGRDAAHKRLTDLIQAGKPLPLEIQGQIIYYVGPPPPNLAGLLARPDPPPATAWTLTLRS